MQAIRLVDFGGSDALRLEQMPRPQPGPGQVLVAVRSIGVNPVDWKIREGYLRERMHLPMTAGQDFAGEVVEIGSALGSNERIRSFQSGERVFGFAQGAYAEFALANGEQIAPIPEGVDFATAAALPTPGLTAEQMVTRAAVREGDRVLIHGAGGSVGSLALQLCAIAQADITATVLGHDAGFVASLGADRVIDNKAQRFEDEIPEVDTVLDLVGGEVQRRSWRLIRAGGCLVTSVGLGGGDEQAAAERRGVRPIAFVMQRDASGLERVSALVADGRLQVRIAKVLPFPQAREAQDLSQLGGAHGKILLRVA